MLKKGKKLKILAKMYTIWKYFGKDQVIACDYYIQWTARKGSDWYWNVSNGSSKISFVFLLREKFFFPFVMFWYCEFQTRWEKLHWEKWKMGGLSQIIIC